ELPLRGDYGRVHSVELRAATPLPGDAVVEHARDVSVDRPTHHGGEGRRSQGGRTVPCATWCGEGLRRPLRRPQCDLGRSWVAAGTLASWVSPSGDGPEIPALVRLSARPDDGRGRFPAADLCRRRVHGCASGGGPGLHARRLLHRRTLVVAGLPTTRHARFS